MDAGADDLKVLFGIAAADAAWTVDVAVTVEDLEFALEDLVDELRLGVELVAKSLGKGTHVRLEIGDGRLGGEDPARGCVGRHVCCLEA